MQTRTIEIQLSASGPVRLTLGESNGVMMMRRALLAAENTVSDDPVFRLLRWYYVDLVAAVTEIDGIAVDQVDDWPPAFDDFVLLPEQTLKMWEETVYDLNPHWLPKDAEDGEKKDKATRSTPG